MSAFHFSTRFVVLKRVQRMYAQQHLRKLLAGKGKGKGKK
jgi:hypothetical protein